MIKKTFLTLFCLFLGLSLFSKNIDQETAARVAKNFYFERAGQYSKMDYSQLRVNLVEMAGEKGEIAYYAFNVEEGGYIVVAADDRVTPVLCYSFESSWGQESLPVQMIEWMAAYKKQIQYHRSQQTAASEEIRNAWSRLITDVPAPPADLAGTKSVSPLLISNWNQGAFFNELCPLDPAGPGGRVYAGCVATAMAQVMYYYRWPRTGVGSHSYYSSYGNLNADFGGTSYDWNSMLNSLNSSNLAVATLLYHCGVAVEMMYSPGGSGAYSEDAADALRNFFRYSNSTQMVYKDDYTSQDWASLLMAQLDARKPMYYHGYGSGGHAFNVDGYQGNDFFHFNWGWGGSYNGYFYLDNLNPGGSNFTSGQGAMINIYPNGSYPPNCTGNTLLTALSGTFEDGSGPDDYPDNEECYFLISPQVNPDDSVSKIILKFNRFDSEANNDLLTIYDGNSENDPVLGVFSGNTLPPNISSSGNAVLLKFKTNGNTRGNGWFISYESKLPIYCSGLTTLTALSGSFDDGSQSKKYNNKSICQWLIQPHNVQKVTLTFDAFDLENGPDFIEIYSFDTLTFNGTLIAHYTGNIIPPSVSSLSGAMFLIFYTNSSNNSPGWSAHYTAQLVGLEENEWQNQIDVFPNPTEKLLHLTIPSSFGPLKISLLSTNGQVLLNREIAPAFTPVEEIFDLGNFAKGMYFFSLRSEKGIMMRKVILQ